MAKSFKKLKETLTVEEQYQVAKQVNDHKLAMALQELRQSRDMTQKQLAELLNINQAALSKMENQSDMRLSTLRKVLEAMGGKLKLVAEFPEEDVIINQFELMS